MGVVAINGKQVAAIILGVIGGLIGLVACMLIIPFNTFYWVPLGCFVMGLIGTALALSNPRLASALMEVGAIGGAITMPLSAFIVGPLLLFIAGLMATRSVVREGDDSGSLSNCIKNWWNANKG